MLAGKTPFGTPLLEVMDTVRVVCIVFGLVNVILLVRIFVNVKRRVLLLPTKWGVWATAFLTVSAVFTEMGRVGARVTWRLPFNLAGVVAGVIYSWRVLQLFPKDRWGGVGGEDPWTSPS